MDGPEKELKHLQLMEQASASISDGDLVDSLIHGYVAELVASFEYSYLQIVGLNSIGVLCLCTLYVQLFDRRHVCMVLESTLVVLIRCHSPSAFRHAVSDSPRNH